VSDGARARLAALLSANGGGPPPRLDRALADRLVQRIDGIRLFAHPYSFVHNMKHGGLGPLDVAEFAYQHELAGLCMHVNDGGPRSLSRMTAGELAGFRDAVRGLGLALHLEVSSTTRAEIDRVVALARALEVQNIRVYSRHAGRLSAVLEETYRDLCYCRDQAVAHDLHFDFEQHEEYRAREIAGLLERVGHPRINALFDFGNMINAGEEPLDALHALAPYIRQVHVKGARRLAEDGGHAQLGVIQGGPADELPGPRMLFELLLLGDAAPQVVCFALEQEVNYYAPPLRRHAEPADPVIRHREPSQTPLDPAVPLARQLLDERRWAANQVTYVRGLLARLRDLAEDLAAGR
jgi:hypothetical protein